MNCGESGAFVTSCAVAYWITAWGCALRRPQSTGQALGFGHPTSATVSMFSCRMCSENPFNAMFGEQGKADKEKKKKDKRRTSKRNEGSFHPRTDDEVASAVSRWIRHAHPRANDFFTSQQQLHDVLTQLAKGIDREDDPILGGDEKCVYWYGDVTKEDLQAAIRMVKPGENAESVTYVNRVLAFIFATDESFDRLMKLPKEPFKMSCGDQLCVNLSHISVETTSS
mmetsp:Transcript_47584/g.103710  ORF Transcript_47584/g.103710 Transcript_47584/m.103710 type:complete len:226 (-) Transcript_47584:173-850(-)